MKIMRNKIILAGLVGTAVIAAMLSYGRIEETHSIDVNQHSQISGLKPNSSLSYEISYQPEYNGIKAEQGLLFVEDVANVDEKGVAKIPSMKPYYKAITVRSKDADQPLNLKISNFSQTGRLQINADGFSGFSNVVIEESGRSRSLKTDWAGQFESLLPSHFDKSPLEGATKLAFSGMSLNDAPENPAMIEVVIMRGGGPTAADVNVYNPAIHDYNCGRPVDSIDGESVFRPSTCDVGRMQATIDRIPGDLIPPLMLMAEQLSAVMMQQMQIVGSFLDAKEQVEAQRDFQQLSAQAHKDYHPSEQMCQFGSYVRSISQTELAADHNKMAINKVMGAYMSQTEEMVTAEGMSMDVTSRLAKFKTVYCDPNQLGGALWEFCRSRSYDPPPDTMPLSADTGVERDRFNKDIDYFSTFDRPLTVAVDFRDDTATTAEEDVLALAKNLYWPMAHDYPEDDVFESGFEDNYHLYLATRNILSKYNVAQNSFASIMGMKSSPPQELAIRSGPAYMKSFMRDFDLTEVEINEMMGENPSYYAQMEFMTKKLYQHPTFYTSLYDKPANVDRINVTLEAIQLMQGRDHYESMLRQEMLVSMLVEQEIMKNAKNVNGIMYQLGDKAKTANPEGYP